ncbi:MAG: hypothetical protein K0S74_672 [Chlamydiales bacterium]|jgi:CheY-like chemotaxis protein|nr:hypothetical protein [Chlamydiales bacterium]
MKKKIAIIEDNRDNRLLLTAILSPMYEVHEYVNGIDGLQGIGVNLPDLILLDISLPLLDGIEILRRIKENPNYTMPIIASTAHAMKEHRDYYLQQGFDDYIAKPIIDFKSFRTTIAHWIDRVGSCA